MEPVDERTDRSTTETALFVVLAIVGFYYLRKWLQTFGPLQLTLNRTYYTSATNGEISGPDGFICYSIELPNLNNQYQVSCIPGGGATYELNRRYTSQYGNHLILLNVPNRSGILIHPANYISQLLGCIAPVTTLASPGVGYDSVKATNALNSIAFAAIDAGRQVFLTIK